MRKFIHLLSTFAVISTLALINTGCTSKIRETYHLRKANKFFDAGQYGKAEIEYLRAAQLNPKNAKTIGRLGAIYFDEGRFSRAFAFLSRDCQLTTNDIDAHLKLGLIELSVGQASNAWTEANLVLNRRPDDAEAPLLLAEVASSKKQIAEVRERLEKMSRQGDSAPLEIGLGTLAFRDQDLKTAEADFKRAQTLDPKSSYVYSSLGNLYLAQKDLKQAEGAFKTAADLAAPRSPQRLQYAQFMVQKGDLATGENFLKKMVQETPDYLPAWNKLAEIAATQKKFDEANEDLATVLGIDPDNYEALLLSGSMMMEQGQTTQAITVLEKMAKVYSQAPRPYYQLALAYAANNDNIKALVSVNQALRLLPDYPEAILLQSQLEIQNQNVSPAIASLTRLIGEQPKIIEARLMLAAAYRAQGDFEDALKTYSGIEKTFPQSPEAPALMGTIYLQQNKTTEARAAFNQALQISSTYFPAIEQLVNMDLADKQFTPAMRRVQTLQAKYPASPKLELLLAKIYAAQNDTNQAQATLLKTIELEPDSQLAYLLLAQLYVSSHQEQKAIADLKTATEKNPKDVAALMLMGMIYSNEKDYNAAKDAYEKLLQINPQYGAALNNLAYLYSVQFGQVDKAYDLARQARELFPTDPATADTLGWVLYMKGQYPAALNLFQESAAKLSAQPEIQYHLGMGYYMTGNEGQARAALQRALQLGDKFDGADDCRQALSVLAIDPNAPASGSKEILDKRIASHPGDFVAMSRLATIYKLQNDTGKEIQTLEQVLNLNPNDVKTLVKLARLYEPQDAQKALGFAKTAYQLAPENPDAIFVLGHLAYQTGDYRQAFSLLQIAAQNQPKSAEVLYDFAEAAYSQGDVADARAAMQTVLQTTPTFSKADGARQFLEITALADNPQQAMSASGRLDQILKTNSTDVPALMVLALNNEQKNNFDGAKQAYEKILAQYPNFSPAQRRLTILYAENPPSDNQRAYDVGIKARIAFPDDPQVAKSLGIISYRQGNYVRAKSLLTEAEEKQSKDAELVYYLGMAQYQLKDKVASKASLQRALALNLSGKPAEQAKTVLATLK